MTKGQDTQGLFVDAVGFRITTDNTETFDLNTSLSPVPLTDTYDPTKLEFVSASVPPSSVDAVGGSLTWDDIGPINAGLTKRIEVTFKALEPVGNATELNITNTGTVNNAFFANGLPATDDTDSVIVTLEPTGSITGTIWSEGSGGATGWVDTVGYEAGTDFFVAGVTVNLYACLDGGNLLDSAGVNPNKGCVGNGGEWTIIDIEITDANGDYLFDGVRDGYYYVEVDSSTIPGTVSQTGDPDETPGQCSTCDNTWKDPGDDVPDVLIIANANDLTNGNFGYDVPPAIFGMLWEDHDGDGMRDAGDDPLSGWTVTYSGSDSSSGSMQTGADGSYLFENLVAGVTYTIVVTTPSGETWVQTV